MSYSLESEFEEDKYETELDKKSFSDYFLKEINGVEIDKKGLWGVLSSRQKRFLILLCRNKSQKYVENRLHLGNRNYGRVLIQIQKKVLRFTS